MTIEILLYYLKEGNCLSEALVQRENILVIPYDFLDLEFFFFDKH